MINYSLTLAATFGKNVDANVREYRFIGPGYVVPGRWAGVDHPLAGARRHIFRGARKLKSLKSKTRKITYFRKGGSLYIAATTAFVSR